MRNRIRDYNKAKAGGKRGVIARRKAELDRETKKLGEMVYKPFKARLDEQFAKCL